MFQNYLKQQSNMMSRLKQRDADPLTMGAVDDLLYGESMLFNLCAGDSLAALSLIGRYPQFLNWLGWDLTNIFRAHEYFITYAGGAGTAAGTVASGTISNPCAPGATVEWGFCDWSIEGFGTFRRSSPVRNMTRDNLRYCDQQPIYRIDGSTIDSNSEWDLFLVTTAIIQDLTRAVITGNKQSDANTFDGLLRSIKTGYQSSSSVDCKEMDSLIIDYAGNQMCPVNGATGVTVNGNGAPDGFVLIDFIKEAIRRVFWRAGKSSFGRSIAPGDMIILMPESWISCLLDCWTCYLKCGGDFLRMDSLDARAFREKLDGGLYGDGQLIGFDGRTIPIMAFDEGLINEPADPEEDPDYTADILILTRTIGGQPVLRGQLKDLSNVPALADDKYQTTDGGKLLMWHNLDNTCRQLHVEMQPRLVNRAPWSQIRIKNVKCNNALGHISSDYLSPLFYGTLTKVGA